MAMTTLNIQVNVPTGKVDLSELTHEVTMYAQYVASRLGRIRPEREEKCTYSSDASFFKDFLSMPFDNPTSADEEEKMIRSSHYFDNDRMANQFSCNNGE